METGHDKKTAPYVERGENTLVQISRNFSEEARKGATESVLLRLSWQTNLEAILSAARLA